MSSVKHCSHCENTGYEMLEDERVYCPTCNGRGWVTDDGPNEYAKAGHAFTGDAQRFDAERRSASASEDVVEQQDADAAACWTNDPDPDARLAEAFGSAPPAVSPTDPVEQKLMAEATNCNHPRLRPQVYDQTLGVWCPDCSLAEWCWAERHVSEALWNMACKNDPNANPCVQSRPSHCAMCDERTDASVEAEEARHQDEAARCAGPSQASPAQVSPACSQCTVEPATHCARFVAAAEVHARRMGQLDQIGQQVEGIGRAIDSREQCGESADLETAGAVYRNGVRDGRREAIEACAALVETLPSMGLREVAARIRSDPFTFATPKEKP